MFRAIAILTLALTAACSAPDPLADLQPGERGRVVRVIDGDALVLDTGQSIRLVGIEAPPRAYKEREAGVFAEESKRMLEDMALGREVRLFYGGLTRDRYDRALAHVVTDDALGDAFWLNLEMAKRGGARLRVYSDTAAANAPILDAEREAREAKLGLWAKADYRIADASSLPDNFKAFQIVEGILGARASTSQQGASCEFELLSSDLRLEIKTSAAQLCQSDAGLKVRARGYVYEGNLEVVHPLNFETLMRE